MQDTPRRLLLRLGVKLMGLSALLLSVYILIASVSDNVGTPEPETAPLQIDLAALNGATFSRIPWSGGNLLLLRRNTAQLESLPGLKTQLLDPQSRHAEQPPGLPAPQRSHLPDYFLAYDKGGDMGCPLNWIPAGDRTAPQQPWPGGFRDSCQGAWYDAAGRVFRNQQASRNLTVPPHRLIGPDLLEVGVNGDNPASAN